MKLPQDLVEWYFAPEPGQQGVITALKCDAGFVACPHIVVRLETIRIAVRPIVDSVRALIWADGRARWVDFRRSSEAVVPNRMVEG